MRRLLNRAAAALGATALATAGLTAGLVATAPASTAAAAPFKIQVINKASCASPKPQVRVTLAFRDKKGTSIGFDSTRDPDFWWDKLHNVKDGTYTLSLPAVPSGYTETFRIKLEHNPGSAKRRTYHSAFVKFAVPAGCPGSKKLFTTMSDPTVRGSLRVGETVRADIGPWAPKPTVVVYQWQRAHGGNIKGATKATYRLTGDDVRRGVRVIITAKHAGYENMRRTSSWTASVKPAAFTGVRTPSVNGTPRVGKTLMVGVGTWTPKPTKLAFQWYRSGKPIPRATGKTYKLTTADKGKRIHAIVRGTRLGYVARSVSTPAVTVR